MTKTSSGFIPVIRPFSLDRALIRKTAALARIYHTSLDSDDKSSLLMRLISCCLERTRTSVQSTLAFRRLSLRRYCCKNEIEDDTMTEIKRNPAADQLIDYKKNLKVNTNSSIKIK